MSGFRAERLEQLFDQAIEREGEARLAFLDEHCQGEAGLRAELEQLLAHDSSASNTFLDNPIDCTIGNAVRSSAAPFAGDVIAGRYTLQHIIGEGGMGVVWLAQQQSPQRDVALKLIRPGLAGRHLLRRFEFEATVLGLLKHPGIAQIYEAGMHDDGSGTPPRPFFAMEHIDGLPLKQHVKAHAPSMRERLQIFVMICDAVQHAHQKGVIHRDLKPGNILVVDDKSKAPQVRKSTGAETADRLPPVDMWTFGRVDFSAQPKILDFGVARATDSDLQLTTMQTEVGQLVGTLSYMSPEQVAGRSERLDTRSDVYALGVILYELLADRLPHELTDKTIPAAARVIVDEEPAPLTTINRMLRGDLNTIVLKSLEKDPDQRYQSASELAAEIRRYLNHEPIVARPASTIYHLRKFARRNRGLVGGAAVAFVLLLAGIGGTTFGMFRAQDERDNAQRQQRIAQAVNDFLNTDLLSQANPYIRPGTEARLRDVLDQAGAAIDARFPDEPEIEALIRLTLGKTYVGLGDFKSAARHLQRTADLEHQLGQTGEWVKTKVMLATALTMDWQLDAAEPMLRENMQLAAEHFGAVSVPMAESRGTQGIVLKRRGRFAEAETEYRAALDIFDQLEKTGGIFDDEAKRRRITARNNLALVLRDQGKLDEAETIMRGVVDDWTALRGRRHADTAYGINNLGDIIWHRAKPPKGSDVWDQQLLAEAEQIFREALDIRMEVLGENHPDTYFSIYAIGSIEMDTGRYEQAEQTMRRVLAFRERTLDPHNGYVLTSLNTVGVTLKRQQRHAEAAEMFAEALRRTRAAGFDPEHPDSRMYRNNLIGELRKMDDQPRMREAYLEYFEWLEQSLESDALKRPADRAQRASLLAWRIATCEIEDLRDAPRAVALARQADEIAPDDPKILQTLAAALAAGGQVQEALAAAERAIALLADDAPARDRESLQQIMAELQQQLADGD